MSLTFFKSENCFKGVEVGSADGVGIRRWCWVALWLVGCGDLSLCGW